MDTASLLTELYSRLPPLAKKAIEGCDLAMLGMAPEESANTIAWLIWHPARVQDQHLAEILEQDQIWMSGAWSGRFGLEADPSNTGYGHQAAQVLALRPERPEVLCDYLAAVCEQTQRFLAVLDDAALDRIVDRRWDPPVSLGVRLISVANDNLQHLGQALYVRGMLQRRAAS